MSQQRIKLTWMGFKEVRTGRVCLGTYLSREHRSLAVIVEEDAFPAPFGLIRCKDTTTRQMLPLSHLRDNVYTDIITGRLFIVDDLGLVDDHIVPECMP